LYWHIYIREHPSLSLALSHLSQSLPFPENMRNKTDPGLKSCLIPASHFLGPGLPWWMLREPYIPNSLTV
jgi:hypothetical protein